MRSLMSIVVLAMGLTVASCSQKTDSDKVVDEFKDAGQKMEHGIDKGVRAVKDETCEMYDSKAECAAKEAKHKVQNAMDDASED